jgi:hypothetical protein
VPDERRWLPWRIRAAVAAGRVDEAALQLRELTAAAADTAGAAADSGERAEHR